VRAEFVHYIQNHLGNYTDYRATPLPSIVQSNTFSGMTGSCAPQKGMRCVSASRPSPNQDFQSPVTMTWMQPISFRFLAPRVADALYGKYFNGKRKLGMLDREFFNRFNATIVCLTYAILCHQLRAYRHGVNQDSLDFKPDTVGVRRPLMSPLSLVYVLMTNQSCKTFSYSRRTPGRQYHGQRRNSCAGICMRRSQPGSSKIIV